MADNIVRISREDDPERCQGVSLNGQCQLKSVKGTKFCDFHGNGPTANQEKRNYRLKKWQARVNEFADNEKAKSLREEVGVTRMVLEELIGRCESGTDLVLHSNKISQLVMQIEKLVTSCHKLEKSTGSLLDVDQILRFADAFLRLLEDVGVKDPAILDQLTLAVPKLIENVGATCNAEPNGKASG